MRKLLTVLVLGVLGALAFSGRAARDTPPPARPAEKATESPAPAAAAIPSETGLRIVDAMSGRTRREIDVGHPLRLFAWTGKDRLVAAHQNELYEIDARAGRVLHTEIARGDVLAVARRGDGYVTVQARRGRAELHFRDDWVPIVGVRASGDVRRMIVPGLAVDGDTAYVVDAVDDRFAVVDMNESTVRVQSMGVARASKGLAVAVRHAAYLGDGRLAVSGERRPAEGEAVPYGLRLVDVNALRTIMLAPRQTELAAGRSQVVAWRLGGGGIAVYGRGGGREHRLLRGEDVYRVDVIGGLAHVQAFRRNGRRGRNFVVALASGRVVRGPRATKPPGSDTLLGVSHAGAPHGRIALYDPVTLRRKSRGAVVHGQLWDWDRAPGGDRVALAVSNRGRLEIFDARAPRRARRIEVGGRMAVHALRWPARDRLLALVDRTVLEIDVPSGRVLARRSLPGLQYARARTSDGIAVLLGPEEGESEARLMLLRAGQKPRRIDLTGVRAAVYSRWDVRPDDPPDLMPALAVDGDVAYVAPTGAARILRVDLSSGAVTSHSLRAAAARGGAGQTRFLQALGGGRLLLSGQDVTYNGHVDRAFSRVVDTSDWSQRTLSEDVADAVGSPAGIVLTRYCKRSLTIHDLSGRRIARHRPRHGISAVRIAGRHAYVANGARRGRDHRTHVYDLRTGRRVRTLPFSTVPVLLTRRG